MEAGYNNVSWEAAENSPKLSSSPSFSNQSSLKNTSLPTSALDLPPPSSLPSPLNDDPFFASKLNLSLQEDLPQLDSSISDFDIQIVISEPRKEGEGSSYPYISFLVSTTKLKRRRRYKDFAWLHDNLASVYTSVAVPCLPPKSRLEYISGNRFNPDFVSRRREGLERFIYRIATHPVLKKTPYFHTFIEAKDWSSQYEEKTKKDIPAFDGISDTILNSFSKIKNRDPQFTLMGEAISRIEENVMRALKVTQNIIKNQQDLEKYYKDFSSGWNDLAQIETDLTSILVSVSNSLALHAAALKSLSDKIEKFFAMELEEHLSYCHVFKNLLKTRDSKQIEYEELLEYYKTTDLEKDRLINYQSATGVSLVTNFIKGKVRDLRGIDPGVSRQQRIATLKKRCAELNDAADSAKTEMLRFNKDVIIEYEIFNLIKDNDLKRCLQELSCIHIEYFEKLLPTLENIKLDNP
ncbi:hypothetical protein BB561_004972 [Smittium simulii]|uniref:Sorting nexin-4 n=1 Tax=Smittium simulii TaxID=133385 RepID=A0A2T9YD21_9FUNG|nr:hypothetical protein BB561_004972 [Smittium simulii]